MSKTTLPEQTKEILKGMFAQGMVSKGKKCSVLHNQAVERTGLPLQVIKEQFTDIADWAPAWNLLGQEEKEQYKKKAQEKPVAPPKPQQKDAFKRLKIIREHVIELEKLGMDVALIGINTNNGAQILLGDGKSAAFLKLEDILQNWFAFHSLGTKEVPKDLKSLQKEAQTHMNKLYSKAVGKKTLVPIQESKNWRIASEWDPP